jgi:hypothetical protein
MLREENNQTSQQIDLAKDCSTTISNSALCTHTYTHTKHLFFFLLHTYSSGLDPRVPEILSPVWKNLWNKIVGGITSSSFTNNFIYLSVVKFYNILKGKIK